MTPSRSERRESTRLDDGTALGASEDDFAECRKLVERYLVRHRNYYRRRANTVRKLFRTAGVAVIVVSASLPVAAAIEWEYSRLTITILSVLVAALTALRAFFQWDVQWRVLRQADWKLTYLLAKWEAEIQALRDGEDPTKVRAVAITQALLSQGERVVEDEASSFFRGLGWPHPDTQDVPKDKLDQNDGEPKPKAKAKPKSAP